MEQVELLERCPVTLLATLDETANVGVRILRGPRSSLGGFFGHQRGNARVGSACNSETGLKLAAEPNPTRLSRANLFT